jgi:hypothetical protein
MTDAATTQLPELLSTAELAEYLASRRRPSPSGAIAAAAHAESGWDATSAIRLWTWPRGSTAAPTLGGRAASRDLGVRHRWHGPSTHAHRHHGE